MHDKDIGNQRRLRPAYAVLPELSMFAHINRIKCPGGGMYTPTSATTFLENLLIPKSHFEHFVEMLRWAKNWVKIKDNYIQMFFVRILFLEIALKTYLQC